MGKLINLTGHKFARLSVIGRDGCIGTQPAWNCVCDCGSTKRVLGHELRNGGTQSCGCLRDENIAEVRKTHGMSKVHRKEFRIWTGMHDRTKRETSTIWKYYGGAGVKVCDKWEKFDAFYADMGPRPSPEHSIDRIDPFGDYEPSNCRWATAKEQANNRRMHHMEAA